ncbi:AN1-type zinc finger protein 1 [Cercospora beticola]|uniref:AN1-type zinc finger protein 1 n=1 Tax=Cercospora beticola TaxID=122368 RepID=A0A2G5HLB0_CERBT|nr:AN1-type zinc finger protein 1 [Cercospora beticola]PIA93305.1 AN1-type zinc finger protein 1 [Cercospora beticola]WPB01297.1 hypothetical protein RHO25_005921 [Cercospora beticola]CAK1363933.1 unnamed protein product [Cercospora beticola]
MNAGNINQTRKVRKFDADEPFIVTEAARARAMSADFFGIGAQCQAEHCRQLDFLPFKCQSCNGTFCLDHRTEDGHACAQKGAFGRRNLEAFRNAPAPNKLKDVDLDTYKRQCCEPTCKTTINHALTTGIYCEKCRRAYCLKHRYESEHNCDKLVPLGLVNPPSPLKEKRVAALDRLKAWGMSKKSSFALPESKAKKSAAADLAAVSSLKRTAKGEEKIPQEKRVYVFVEASSDTVTAKVPKGNFFYSTEYSVGRVLDLAAKSLSVSNVNNLSPREEDKLRVFHVEGGSLLDFGDKLGQKVKTGDTIVLLRGVGAGMASTPDQTN